MATVGDARISRVVVRNLPYMLRQLETRRDEMFCRWMMSIKKIQDDRLARQKIPAGARVTRGHSSACMTAPMVDIYMLSRKTQNITLIGKQVVKLWPFLYIQDGRQPPSWISSNRK